jgi:HAD superfamily hydrolase (TIGR01490 family)
MDHTLIDANSGRVYARALSKEGQLNLLQSLKVAVLIARYKIAGSDMSDMLRGVVQGLQGKPEQEVVARCARLFHAEIAPTLFTEALAVVQTHRAAGEPIVVLSASTPYFVRLLADHISADGYLCTRPLVENGIFTGACDEPVCYGPGKLEWARRYCSQHGLSLSHSAFYTDSYSDVSVLEAVGRPVVVNPDPRLRRHAQRRGWPIVRYRTRVSAGSAGPSKTSGAVDG